MDSLVVKKKSDSDVVGKQYSVVIFSGFVGKAITLKVQGLTDESMYYRIGMNMSLKFLMNHYCQRMGFVLGTIAFIGPSGNILKETNTALELGMEDDNVIDAFLEQGLGSMQCGLVVFSEFVGKAITIKVQGQDDDEDMYYRIGMNMKMKFLMNDYGKRFGRGLEKIIFIGEVGNRLIETRTPLELKLRDDDVIYALHDPT